MGVRWRSTLRLLRFGELLRLRRALSGSSGIVVDGELYAAVDDLIWKRARPWTRWPTADGVVSYCGRASGPDDPAHRCAKRLALPATRAAGRPWYACSCGQRDGGLMLFGATARRRRLPGTAGRWISSSSAAARRLHLRDVPADVLIICPGATGPDDLAHMLTQSRPGSRPGDGKMRATFTCLCGRTKYDDEMAFLPMSP